MKPDVAIQQSTAYSPIYTIVEDTLREAAEVSTELRTLLLKSAILQEFDAGLLSRLADRQEEDRDLLDEVTFFMPVEEIDENTFCYDEFTRQALLDKASEEDEQIPVQASQIAADYYREQARETKDATLSRKYEQQVLYYQLLADPKQGYADWLEAWAAVSTEHADFDRQAELILVAREAWDSLADVPEAQVNVLLKKGWLAFDLGDRQGAIENFWKLLAKDADTAWRVRFYVKAPFSSLLVDGEYHPLVESEAHVGLGYAYFRQGTLGWAAEHFEKAIQLISKQPDGQGRAAKIRAKALCGLGEVCARMGTPEDALLRHLLLPEEERHKTQLQHAQLGGPWSLEDLALYRLQMEADRFFERALEAIVDRESAAGDWRRIQALQARLYLEQGDWEWAHALFEEVRRQELARLGVDSERSALKEHRALLAEKPRNTERLARINLCLGDWCLLAAETPDLVEEELSPEPASLLQQHGVRLKEEILERVAKRRKTKLALATEQVCDETAESEALEYYDIAWSLWKQINMREGMALSLRRQADVAAVHLEDPGQRDQALHLYKTSLGLYEQIGNTSEVARAQERIELLRERAEPPEEDHPAAHEETVLAEFAVVEERPAKKAVKKGSSVEEFQKAAENVLAHRRRFFRYRVARKLKRRLRRIYRLNAALSGLVVTGVLCGWLVWLAAPWLSQISARVTGLPWALPALGVSFIVVIMILMADEFAFIRRWTVRMIPLSWFWFSQDQVAIDDIGLHLYDHTGQRKRLIRWQDVWQVRSQTWEEEEEKGGRTAVFGTVGQVIRFDYQLRRYWRLLPSIRSYIAATGDPERWQEPEEAYLEGSFFLWSGIVLVIAISFACPLTLVFALIPAITRFGPTFFGVAAGLVAIYGFIFTAMRYSEWRFMHPRRKRPKPTIEKSTV